MQRPPSIVMFERLYLGSFVLWLIVTAVFWNTTQAMIQSNPQMAGNPMAGMMSSVMGTSVVVVAIVTLLLWYLVARRASVVAKWFVVVFEAIGALTALLSLLKIVTGKSPNLAAAVLGLVVTGLAIAAAVQLFKADAKAWFGESTDPTEPLA